VSGPPRALVRSLVEGSSALSGLEWHDEVTSTQARGVAAALAGVPEIHAVVAGAQTAGRGRLGRPWVAPAGTSLLASFVLRPTVPADRVGLLPLLAGLALAEVADRYCPRVALKWPNDLLVGGRKAAGILAERLEPSGAVVLGVGVNVDWRGLARPPEVAQATSLAEAAGADVDRWRVLAALVGLLGRRYHDWTDEPAAFLAAYRRRCATIGCRVRVTRPAGDPVEGLVTAVDDEGALCVRDGADGAHRLSAGDVEHVRPA
jgi:BirA family transcriptional regulator, biotin operon repressor / biotin---[acetyl-CoA-carboxylase] ligase